MDNIDEVLDVLELRHILDRDVNHLSGGELQRFAVGTVCVQKADVYMFDDRLRTWTRNNVSLQPASLSVLLCMPRRRLSLSSMTSSWLLIWQIVSLSLMATRVSMLAPISPSHCLVVATGS
ncbi:hypothetical protein F4779DRAFT_527025 [Xylariaceae sp. FL0662B]|nr:hypothetical protein F4779DRAFT_527025 [Xylariaceae sp. FL0662B]